MKFWKGSPPGQGRGHRLACHRADPFMKWNHALKRSCQICGAQKVVFSGEVGQWGAIRFVEAIP